MRLPFLPRLLVLAFALSLALLGSPAAQAQGAAPPSAALPRRCCCVTGAESCRSCCVKDSFAESKLPRMKVANVSIISLTSACAGLTAA